MNHNKKDLVFTLFLVLNMWPIGNGENILLFSLLYKIFKIKNMKCDFFIIICENKKSFKISIQT